MAKNKRAGRVSRKAIEWIRRANHVTSQEEARKIDEEFTEALKRGEFAGWEIHFSAVSDLHPTWTTLDDRKTPIVYVESPISGVRVCYFFNDNGEIIGRSYFDRGDISLGEVRNQILCVQLGVGLLLTLTVFDGRGCTVSIMKFPR